MREAAVLKNADWENFNSSLLIEVSRPEGVFTCTGVAVSPFVILTAAHCLEGKILKIRVFLENYYDPQLEGLKVRTFKLHPRYRPKKSRYISDLAKIYLQEPLPSSINIPPLFTGQIIYGDLYRFGFGERLKKNLRTVTTPKLKEVRINDGLIEFHDKYSFSGDSGGPIYLRRDGRIYLLAVHSTLSFGPEGNFSYNPLVGAFKSWIFVN
jgi:secreted trypsin-like serine protease